VAALRQAATHQLTLARTTRPTNDRNQAREDYDVRVMQLAKARREGATKAKSGRGGATRLEARLNTKKHRATSRRRAKQDAALWEEDGEEGEEGEAEEEAEEAEGGGKA
jgi:hypothetical protein